MSGTTMREVLLHGGMDEAFDRSVVFARQLAESFGARLHVIYTLEDPLAAGWTAEVSADRLPEVHQAIEDEARERLSRGISLEDQERLGIQLVLRPVPRTRRSFATPTNTPSTSPSSRPPPGNSRRSHTRSSSGSMRGARAAVIPSDLLLAAYSSGWFPMAVESGRSAGIRPIRAA